MRCYIIRHAHKEFGGHYNPRLRHQDEPISQKGREQAQKLVSFFDQRALSAIYVSGYLRTMQTAEPLAQASSLAPIVDERLNEFDNGLIEGMTDEQIQQAYPEVWYAFQEKSADFRFPEGETGAEVQARVSDFLQEKRFQHPDEAIVIVSHDGLIRLLMCTILRLPVFTRWNFYVDFCGITEFTTQPNSDAWRLIRFNQSCQ